MFAAVEGMSFSLVVRVHLLDEEVGLDAMMEACIRRQTYSLFVALAALTPPIILIYIHHIVSSRSALMYFLFVITTCVYVGNRVVR